MIERIYENDEGLLRLVQGLVRCKDCKHFSDGDCTELPKIVSENDFCSFGEKQVASKLKNADDSLLKEDSDGCKEQKSKLESDTISRQAAIDAVEKAVFKGVAKSAIESLPPEEPQRPKGEWIEYIDDRNGRRYVKCSSCNKSTLNAVEYDVLDGERHSMDYCPNCGCDCRGDKE